LRIETLDIAGFVLQQEWWSGSFLPVDCSSMERVVAGFKHVAIAGVSLALVERIILG